MKQTLPKHIAFIVDGNRRWARSHNKSIITGHSIVANKIIDELVFHCLDLGIPYLTFWVFSTENWKRGPRFCNALFKLLEQVLQKNVDRYNQAGIRLNTIGDLAKLPQNLVKSIEKLKQDSQQNHKLVVTLALNYGGRDEMLRAIKKLVKDKPQAQIKKLTEQEFTKYLDTHDLPDPDLIIRTGGSQRLSGYLLWQAQYAELYFTNTLMPDFDTKQLDQALLDFSKRQRRFGA